eukprot:CAMPEP_0113917834 /NCGR_PEP_ID=MMETSP0780_2-20120614/32966_1 /TAXON_ID=652834 /ORGANISM="Palpitomonas bilix" /LENGTH=530 /DNA_ID=CAMNT_0000917475 /DNA_START=176 /DNA_END=1768 /DNA_ORIENTATION=+ /assembly_acc=CAM_ASM_000599
MGCGASSQFQRLHGGESLDITPKESNVQGNGRARRRILAQSETVDAPSRLRQRNPPGLRKAVLMREPSDLIDADKVGELPNLSSTKKSNLVEAAVSYAHTSPAHFDGRQQMKSIRLWRGKLEDAGLKKLANLGQGIHGWVDLVFDAREKRVFAAKTIYLDRVFATPNDLSRRGSIKNRNLKKAALSEVPEARLLRNLRHPNVVQLHRVLEAYDRVTLILDYAEGGDLASWMKNTGPVGEGVAAKLMADIFGGLAYLHSKGVSHRDLKPENLLFEKAGGAGNLKIVDFGVASTFSDEDMLQSFCGTPAYISPEVLKNGGRRRERRREDKAEAGEEAQTASVRRERYASRGYDAKCDVWSAGVVLYQLMTGELPFKGATPFLIMKTIRDREADLDHKLLSSLSISGRAFLTSVLRKDPKSRPSAADLLKHAWLETYAKRKVEEKLHLLQREAQKEGPSPCTSPLGPLQLYEKDGQSKVVRRRNTPLLVEERGSPIQNGLSVAYNQARSVNGRVHQDYLSEDGEKTGDVLPRL